MNLNYFSRAARLAGVFSVAVAFAAILAASIGAFAVVAAASFLVLFPLTLLTLPAIKRLVIKTNIAAKLEAKIAELQAVAAAEKAKRGAAE